MAVSTYDLKYYIVLPMKAEIDVYRHERHMEKEKKCPRFLVAMEIELSHIKWQL